MTTVITSVPKRVYDRVVERVDVDETTGCHVSRYSVASHGYKQVGWSEGGRTLMGLCHRVRWIYERGPIAPGDTVDHMCKNRGCVNMDHLRVLSNFENARRTSGRDWPLGECAHGHPNSELRRWSGRMRCRVCQTAKVRLWRQEHRDAYNARQRERRALRRAA